MSFLNSIQLYINNQMTKINNFCFKLHPNGHAMFNGIDELISLRENFIDYIKFEYSISILYNIILSIPSIIYLYISYSKISSCDIVSTIWLCLVSLLKLLEVFPKIMIIKQTKVIENNSVDSIIQTRRLMYLIRSNIFYINSQLGNAMLFLYTIYFIILRRINSCDDAPQFYFIINWLVFGFFLRLLISFINYYLHFKHGVNEADMSSESLYEYKYGVSEDTLNSIKTVLLSKENLFEYVNLKEEAEGNGNIEECSICLYTFEVDQSIKILPCDEKHFFHKVCIDKWLGNHKACPICRKEIKKVRKYY